MFQISGELQLQYRVGNLLFCSSLAKNKWFTQKNCIFCTSMFLTVVHLFYAHEQIAHIALHSFALCVKELLELFAPVALYKRMKVQIAQNKERISELHSFAHKKLSDSLEKRISEFPTLLQSHCAYMSQMSYPLILLCLHVPSELSSHPTVPTGPKWVILSSHRAYRSKMSYPLIPLCLHVQNKFSSHPTVPTCPKWVIISSHCAYMSQMS